MIMIMFIAGCICDSSSTAVSGKPVCVCVCACVSCVDLTVSQVGTTASVPFVSVFAQLSSTVVLPLLLGQVPPSLGVI